MAKPLPPVRACIFDVDGTLINSEDIYTDIYNSILRECGKPDYPWAIKATQQSRGSRVSYYSLSCVLARLLRNYCTGYPTPPRMGPSAPYARGMGSQGEARHAFVQEEQNPARR